MLEQPKITPESNPTPKTIEEILSKDLNSLNIQDARDIKALIPTIKEYATNSKDKETLDKLTIVINKARELLEEHNNRVKPPITTEPLDITKLSTELNKLNPKWNIDTSIEGGVIKTEITEEDLEYLQTMDKALKQFEGVDTTTINISKEFRKLHWTPIPSPKSLNTVVVKAGQATKARRDQLVSDMDSLGYRPLTTAELAATAIKHTELFKEDNSKYFFKSCTENPPSFGSYYNHRGLLLNPGSAMDSWSIDDRFLFVWKGD